MDNFWKNKNVFITGISGFIGSAIAKRLSGQGANIVGLVKDVNRNITDPFSDDDIPMTLAIGDITDFDLIRSIISSKEIDMVFHLAAYSIVRISAKDPMSTYKTNVMGTVSLLEAVRSVNKHVPVIVASSDKAYGDHLVLPYVESQALKPRNTYDTSKACGDLIAQSYAWNYHMPIIVTRCSNVYGPGDFNFSRIIPNSINLIKNGERPMLYSDVQNMQREFIYIDDVAEAYDMLARAMERTAEFDGEAFNIGGTGPVAIDDLVKMISRKMGREDLDPEIIPRNSEFMEIERQYIDASKIKDAVGWFPKTTLHDGLDRTIEWYRRFP